MFFSSVDSIGDRIITLEERLGTYLPNCLCTAQLEVSASPVDQSMAGALPPPSLPPFSLPPSVLSPLPKLTFRLGWPVESRTKVLA